MEAETSKRVRALVAEIIELADDDALDIGLSRKGGLAAPKALLRDPQRDLKIGNT
jgi:hypothetical protein